MTIPDICKLKDIPIGFKYYVELSKTTIKIEPEIKDQYGQIKSYRLWVNLNVNASIEKYSIFSLPVIKKKGKIVVRYEFNDESYESLLNYLLENWNNEKCHIDLSQVKTELSKDNPENEYIVFYSNNFENFIKIYFNKMNQQIQKNSDEKLILKFLNLQKIAQLKFENLKEEDLLSMEDYSQMSFNINRPTSDQYNKILKQLEGVGLTEEQEKKIYIYLELDKIFDGMPLAKEGKHGVLLYGPPGTGKTTTMNTFFKIFEILGYPVIIVNANELISKAQVGAFAAQISKQIFEPAIEKIVKSQKPCLIYVDEATSLVSKPNDSSVSQWYQEGLDTIKAFLNRTRFPGIILCLATNAKISDLDKTIVGDDGRLEAVYFDFLDKTQFEILWEDKLLKNLKIKKKELDIWKNQRNIEKLSSISSNLVSGRFVANFCSSYRGKYLSEGGSIMDKIILMWNENRNLTKEVLEKEIIFLDFYKEFLIQLKNRLNEEIKAGIEEINQDHYFTNEERDTKISELKMKYSSKINEIEDELSNLNEIKPEEITDVVLNKFESALFFNSSNLEDLRKNFSIELLQQYGINLGIIQHYLPIYLKSKNLAIKEDINIQISFNNLNRYLQNWTKKLTETENYIPDQIEMEIFRKIFLNLAFLINKK